MQRLYKHGCKASIIVVLSILLSAQAARMTPALQQNQSASQDKIVKLNVLVLDKENRPVSGLKQEDFRVSEDKSPQTISYFSSDELPLNYCIVLDTSGSTRPTIDKTIDAAQTIVRNNKPGDETSLVEFKDGAELVEEFTASKDSILRALDRLRGKSSRPTAMRDAVYLATQYVAEYKPADRLSRRALIVFTDGGDKSSHYDMDALRKLIRKESIQVFVIGFGVNQFGKFEVEKKERQVLTEIAKETGGQAYFPKTDVELIYMASQMLSVLRTQYVIGYKPARESKKDSYHSVSISVTGAGGKDERVAITRAGYTDLQ
jgi:Ca-activated chloride channel homolog